MKRKCEKCGMIRASKDLVLIKENSYICFSCWNKYIKEKGNQKLSKK